ncbi:EscU/YscU/HrcU family type III secretion system export apparatus switch protein [Salmonella enterica subsp. enterica serovar Bredeney]|nr:EscU/YscU/HrcU family type III secretion system export apparatus switch protein [Salmonella enterica subsp. enterica serovar Bredeney]ECD3237275.1 EscU/YscU/HrcU family type III secretion system export apparatus switch protein [Salmonella enterica subsp. enterica serovar Bredeney]EDO5628545.1 EscU/YscU/HrcU family type III secretion system export apparatus switch protein [Salmonella enterica]HCM6292655.1 EscU/YscU/HrcU family type III secretion system export apparatus switch protein [Salmonel
MAQKTEKPTAKKRKDAAKKGQSFKSKDLVTSIVICTGLIYLSYIFSFDSFVQFYSEVLTVTNIVSIQPKIFLKKILYIFFKMFFPFLLVCAFVGVAIILVQTRFTIASEALKPNFSQLNPVQGLKKIFTIKTLKELVKAICYLFVLFLVGYLLFFDGFLKYILSSASVDINGLIHLWMNVIKKTVFSFIAVSLVVLTMNILVEYFIHFKELKMDKHEVKQEFKENEGNPEIKSARKRVHFDILSGEEKAAIRNSEMVLVNPTHIAIAIYFNPDVAIYPFIALKCSNFKAKAAISYAEEIGVPVVRNIKIARKLYSTYAPHSFITAKDDILIAVIDILIWLRQVENLESNQLDN